MTKCIVTRAFLEQKEAWFEAESGDEEGSGPDDSCSNADKAVV
jgi:hypothetical protein